MAQPAAAAHATLSDAHVLVVDNDPDALAGLGQLLRGWGCRVSAVAGGEDAMRAIEGDPAALWVFDYHLDDGDTGVALRGRLAVHGAGRPTLILSADEGAEVRRDTLDNGLTLLRKPVTGAQLLDQVAALLGWRETV